MKGKAFTPMWQRFLKWFCPGHLHEEIEGDLVQRYERDVRLLGRKRAGRKLFWNTLKFFRPGIILRNRFEGRLIGSSMIINNVTFALRILSRNRTFSIVSVFGLTVSIAASILVVEYAGFELRHDNFFKRSQNIYRLRHDRFVNNELAYSKAMSFPEVGPALKNYLPEVEEVGRLFPVSTNIEPVFTAISDAGERVSFSETDAYLADSTFCKVFDLDFIYGNAATALGGPDRIVLSTSAALRYFGKLDVLGKTLHSNAGMGDVTVTGVFKDLPYNTHMKFDVLMSWYKVYGDRSLFTWDGFYTYVLLKENADPASVAQRLPDFAQSYTGEYYKNQAGSSSQFYLQPLESIHLESHLEGEMKPNGNRDVVYILLIVAGFIVLIAIVNQVNLNTSRSLERLREVGVRKIMGSSKAQLAGQFMVESFLLNISSAAMGVVLAWMFRGYFNSLFDAHVAMSIVKQPAFWWLLAAYVGIVSIVGGFYPAFMLTRYKVHEAIKNFSVRRHGTILQKGMVTFQFTVSLVMIMGTYALFKQVDFMQTRSLGFGIERKLVVKMLPGLQDEGDTTFNASLATVKNNLSATAFVRASTVSSSIPGRKNEWRGRVRLAGQDNDHAVRGNLTRIDEDFIDAFDLRLIAGRNYTSSLNNEKLIIINAETARQLGFTNPADALGAKISTFGDREVIGIVESFHEAGLHEDISPSMFITGQGYMKFLTISMAGGDVNEQIAVIRQIWSSRFPDKPFQYFFLDDFFNRQYHADVIMMKCVGVFSGIAIMIACLGLFALSIHMLYRKTKEVGIKKILGASVANITGELSIGFMIPVVLSIMFAIPIGYRMITWWLSHYAYRIDMEWILFAVPILMMVTIGCLSIMFQSLKAAQKNPVESLKHE